MVLRHLLLDVASQIQLRKFSFADTNVAFRMRNRDSSRRLLASHLIYDLHHSILRANDSGHILRHESTTAS